MGWGVFCKTDPFLTSSTIWHLKLIYMPLMQPKSVTETNILELYSVSPVFMLLQLLVLSCALSLEPLVFVQQ